MADAGDIIVLDVGKTLSKLSRWSPDGALLDKVTRPNAKVEMDGISVLDADGIGAWLTEMLRDWAKHGTVSAIIPVGHGAGVAAIRDGQLAFPPLDYEQAIPEEVMAAYRGQRDPFAENGSPALPMGLNIGAQLHWLEHRHCEQSEAIQPSAPLDCRAAAKPQFILSACKAVEGLAMTGGATLLPWAQYWSWFLSGVASTEVTSLGCHSDLWNPASGTFSTLAKRRGWASQFAPLAEAGDVIGTLKPEFGLGDPVNVHCGLHDSNAALIAARGFPEIDGREATVLSTGTWFIAMRSPQAPLDLSALPEARDCLVNVDAYGQPVPSARFMGGREVELLGSRIDLAEDQAAMLKALPRVLASGSMILPSFAPDCGPFPDRAGEWLKRRPREGGGLNPEEAPNAQQTPAEAPACAGTTPDEQRAAIALYAALMTNTSLDLIGTQDVLLVEGRFARSELFARALATLRPGTTVYAASEDADVSLGALRLINPAIRPTSPLERIAPLGEDLSQYQAQWRDRGGRS